jgi:hypothetical protein
MPTLKQRLDRLERGLIAHSGGKCPLCFAVDGVSGLPVFRGPTSDDEKTAAKIDPITEYKAACAETDLHIRNDRVRRALCATANQKYPRCPCCGGGLRVIEFVSPLSVHDRGIALCSEIESKN